MKRVVFVLLFICGPFLPAAELPASRHAFIVIAHRANHTRAHENTLAAIEDAIKAGVDYVELDVRRTADDEYVLMHDRTIDRMTDGHGAVSGMTLAQLKALKVRDLKKPQIPEDRIPTFKEALAAIKGRVNVYLDFKEGDRSVVARAIRDAGVSKQILVYDDSDAVPEWRTVAPELPLIVSPKSNLTPELLAAFISKMRIEVLDGPWNEYSPQMVEAAKKAGATTWPDIQNSQEDWGYFEKVLAIGFTGVQTDHPEELIAWLTLHHRR